MADNTFWLSYITRDHSPPDGKPKVYFTCHPEDFELSFKKICADIFASHDCTIYYTKDMTLQLPDDHGIDLERMNMFVVPVSSNLIEKKNRAMNFDFNFAVYKGVPILPILMEDNIDLEKYNDRFEGRQFLDPFSKDLTEVNYKDKLKKYLDSVLISEETVHRVQKAFDAYVFLSYRKMDRFYANELMRLIHDDPQCRDIAIWFDEFLTPGESFQKNIDKILRNSKLFTLLVTPNLLLNNDAGEPNYIVKTEYPAARNFAKTNNMGLLPVEMIDTDKRKLNELFRDLPDCLPAKDKIARSRMVSTISRFAHMDNKDDPTHNFLIGLAYLNGIDVEINKGYALKLLKKAHRSGLIEATKQLSKMYVTGNGVKYDVYKAAEYELEVISKLKNAQIDTHSKKQLIAELIDMADICTYGTEEKMEPSPRKTLSIPNAINYYREAVRFQEEIINSSEKNENDIRLIRKYLSVLCNMLHGWKSWTNMTYDEVIKYHKKFAKYSTDLGELSDFAEDIFYWRESSYFFLKELHYDSSDYEDVFRKTIEAAKAAIKSGCGNYDFWHEEERVSWLQKKINELDENVKDSKTITKRASLMVDLEILDKNYGIWRDYDRLLDILYYNGVCFYMYLKDYAQVCIWLHECYLKLKEFREIFPKSIERLDTSVRTEFDNGYNQYKFRLHLICSGSVNAIYSLIKQSHTPDKDALVDKIMGELVENHDKDDAFMRDAIIPGLRNMIETGN